jgi:hypothetical protein
MSIIDVIYLNRKKNIDLLITCSYVTHNTSAYIFLTKITYFVEILFFSSVHHMIFFNILSYVSFKSINMRSM